MHNDSNVNTHSNLDTGSNQHAECNMHTWTNVDTNSNNLSLVVVKIDTLSSEVFGNYVDIVSDLNTDRTLNSGGYTWP